MLILDIILGRESDILRLNALSIATIHRNGDKDCRAVYALSIFMDSRRGGDIVFVVYSRQGFLVLCSGLAGYRYFYGAGFYENRRRAFTGLYILRPVLHT